MQIDAFEMINGEMALFLISPYGKSCREHQVLRWPEPLYAFIPRTHTDDAVSYQGCPRRGATLRPWLAGRNQMERLSAHCPQTQRADTLPEENHEETSIPIAKYYKLQIHPLTLFWGDKGRHSGVFVQNMQPETRFDQNFENFIHSLFLAREGVVLHR